MINPPHAKGWLLKVNVGQNAISCVYWPASKGCGSTLSWQDNEQTFKFGWGDIQIAETSIGQKINLNQPHSVFSVVEVDKGSGDIDVWVDPLGIQAVYYSLVDGILWVSSHLMWLLLESNQGVELNPSSFFQHLGFGYVIDPANQIYSNVRRIPPANRLLIRAGKVTVNPYIVLPEIQVDQNPMELVDFPDLLDTLRNYYGNGAISLGLTAGKDSLVLASLIRKNNEVVSGTFGDPHSADRIQAAMIANRLGFEHNEIELCDYEEFTEWSEYIAFHSAGLATSSYADMAKFANCMAGFGQPLVMGEGGECVRDFFQVGKFLDLRRLYRRYITPKEVLEKYLPSSFKGYLGSYPTCLIEQATDYCKADENHFPYQFYRAVRLPGNFSQRHAFLSTICPKISPFVSFPFISLTYGLPVSLYQNSGLHRKILEQARPDFLHFFDNPVSSSVDTQNWRTRFKHLVNSRQMAEFLRLRDAFTEWVNISAIIEDLEAGELTDREIFFHLRVLSFMIARKILVEERSERLSTIHHEQKLLLDKVGGA